MEKTKNETTTINKKNAWRNRTNDANYRNIIIKRLSWPTDLIFNGHSSWNIYWQSFYGKSKKAKIKPEIFLNVIRNK